MFIEKITMYCGFRRKWSWYNQSFFPIDFHLILSLGKTESTKLMVSHIIHCSGDAGDRELRNRIIEVCIKIN
jgi:hypothetical protein